MGAGRSLNAFGRKLINAARMSAGNGKPPQVVLAMGKFNAGAGERVICPPTALVTNCTTALSQQVWRFAMPAITRHVLTPTIFGWVHIKIICKTALARAAILQLVESVHEEKVTARPNLPPSKLSPFANCAMPAFPGAK